MTELQAKLLDMLKWFDSFCRDNQLSYYAVGGTLLGAVRHKGFIPWDDDIDLAMPRPDYERLIKEYHQKEDFDKYVLESEYSDDEHYCYPYSKIYDTSTTLIENVHTGLKRGIFIDIFPIDGIGKGDQPDYIWYAKIKNHYRLYLTRITGIRKGRNLIKNTAVKVMQTVPDTLINNYKLRIKISNMCQKYNYHECQWVGNLVGNWWEKEIVPITFFGTPKEYSFEDCKIFGAEKAEEYLTAIYGAWQTLPPIEKRVTQHDFIELDLHKGYLE